MKKGLLYLLILFLLISLVGCKTNLTKTFFAFNTYIDIKLYEGSEEDLDNIEKIYLEYSNLSDNFESYKDINNVYSINNANASLVIDKRLFDLLDYAYNIKIDGFNILIGNLTNIWKNAMNNKILPSEADINKAVADMNEAKLILNKNTNEVLIEGNATIDLGAIAKGYATSKVKEYLEEKKINKYMINAGSSSILLGEKEKGDYFKVGIKGVSNVIFKEKNRAIGTASILEQNVKIDKKNYNHIINPSTGYCSNMYDTITLIGDDVSLLDILSTSMMLMPLEDIVKYENIYNVKIIIFKDSELIYKSSSLELINV